MYKHPRNVSKGFQKDISSSTPPGKDPEEGVTLNDKSWHVRKVTGARGTHAEGLGRVATAPDDDVDLGPDLGSGLI